MSNLMEREQYATYLEDMSTLYFDCETDFHIQNIVKGIRAGEADKIKTPSPDEKYARYMENSVYPHWRGLSKHRIYTWASKIRDGVVDEDLL